jgi:hypothetical protein
MQDATTVIPIIAVFVAVLLLSLGIFLTKKHNKRAVYIAQKESDLVNFSIDEMLSDIDAQKGAINNKITQGQIVYNQLQEFLEKAQKKANHIDVGLIPPTFDFDDSEELKSAIYQCRTKQYECIKNLLATIAYTDWEFFGSKKDGAKMVADYRLLLLKAFNAEFEAIRKKMRVKTYDTAIKKLERLGEQLQNLGDTANVSISGSYLNLKLNELDAWHGELEAKEELKNQRKLQQAKLREQNKVGGDDSDELEEEIAARESELIKAQRKAELLAGNERAKLELLIKKIKIEKAKLEEKFSRSISQAQITRVGYIYVISNHGCFGEGVVKIGMTRRLEPMDRVNELGDASVPFKFDVHTIAFVEDAPKVEKVLHNKFSKLRVNTENHRKEFFRISPAEVKKELDQMGVISDWYFDVEAKEFNESNLIRNAISEHSKSTSYSKTLPESI